MDWKDKYNVHKAEIGGLVSLVVAWTSEGYKVSVSGSHTFTLKETFESLEDGKTRAVALGKKLLEKALSELG